MVVVEKAAYNYSTAERERSIEGDFVRDGGRFSCSTAISVRMRSRSLENNSSIYPWEGSISITKSSFTSLSCAGLTFATRCNGKIVLSLSFLVAWSTILMQVVPFGCYSFLM